jgi:hypothetical protein
VTTTKIKCAIVLIAACAITTGAHAGFERKKSALREFVKQQACPSTGLHRLPCPGYQIDHIDPLKCLGLDDPINMQWLTIADHKAKTKREANECRK